MTANTITTTRGLDEHDPRSSNTQQPIGDLLEFPEQLFVLESCHSTWLFDEANRRYRRIVKAAHLDHVSTDWRPYDRLVLQDDSDAFVVFLDASGSRVLRSWRHTAHCDRCGGEVTSEMSLDELRRFSQT